MEEQRARRGMATWREPPPAEHGPVDCQQGRARDGGVVAPGQLRGPLRGTRRMGPARRVKGRLGVANRRNRAERGESDGGGQQDQDGPTGSRQRALELRPPTHGILREDHGERRPLRVSVVRAASTRVHERILFLDQGSGLRAF